MGLTKEPTPPARRQGERAELRLGEPTVGTATVCFQRIVHRRVYSALLPSATSAYGCHASACR